MLSGPPLVPQIQGQVVMQKNFTDRFLRTLKPPSSGRTEYYDQTVPGLTLRITATGAMTFALAYRTPGNPCKQKLTLGQYPTVPLAEARQRARQVLNDIANGKNPAAAKQAIKTAPTVADLLTEFWERELSKKKTGAEMRRLLEKDALPAWGKRKVQDITRRDVVVLLDKVRDRGAPVTANRLLGRLTRLFNFACERGILEESPCTRLKKIEEHPRERVLTDTELAAFWQGLDDTGIDPGTALALRLILVTGQRPGEVSGMAWAEVEEDWWTIPAKRTKNGREHRVPLTALAQTLLTQARKLAGESAYVFPSPRLNGRDKPLEVRSLSRAIDRKHAQLGLEKFVPHDLRRSVRTRLAELGIDDVVAERVLNHTLQGIARVYNRHDYDMEKRAALETWSKRLQTLISHEPIASNIVPLPNTRQNVSIIS